jgi:FtsP/CotA-like multicopper oxidase with cupredoxin domain
MTSQDDFMTSQDDLKQEVRNSLVNRRQFLTVGSAALAALTFPGRASAQSRQSGSSSSPGSVKQPAPIILVSDTPFVQQQFKSSENGILKEELRAQNMEVQLNGNTINIATYNRQFPGPTFYVNSGDAIEFTLKNELPPNPDEKKCEDLEKTNTPNCFNTTNLHFHGFHVSPSSKKNEQGETIFSSDDALVAVKPGETHEYFLKLPDFHAPGTHWYHPHRHGSTAKQMAPGMLGALIVKEPSQEENIVAESEDIVWVIQEVNTKTEDIYRPRPKEFPSDFLINGVSRPTIRIKTGTMQRWRFLNGCVTPSGFMRLKLCKYSDDPEAQLDTEPRPDKIGNAHPMYLIALDGISFYGKRPKEYSTTESFKIAPGNRADFLILLNEPGTYKLITEEYPNTPATRNEVLAYVRVEASPVDIALFPNQIPDIIPGDASKYPYLKPITAAEIVNKNPNDPVEQDPLPGQEKRLIFQALPISCSNPPRPVFTINEQIFNHGDPKNAYRVKLNTAEEWTLDNVTTNVLIENKGEQNQVVTCTPSRDENRIPVKDEVKNTETKNKLSPHPFHIHVNPVQVVARWGKDKNGQPGWEVIPEDERIWQDTVSIDPNQPLKIWQRFKNYPGELVFHCHILIHEDQGMMHGVVIEGEGPGPGDPVRSMV